MPDSHEDIANFKKKGNRIILISHQWLDFKTPDTADSLQLRVMQRFVQQMVKKFDVFNVFVWLDYISIAQRRIRQQAARPGVIASVSVAGRFICLVRARRFANRHGRTVRTPYLHQARLCRTEILAKMCSTGLEDMYLYVGDGLHSKPFTTDDLDHISMHVYEGNFTVKSDCEKLVLLILGLYSLILKKKDTDQMREIQKCIDKSREKCSFHIRSS